MIALKMLEESDVIQPDYWCRPLDFTSNDAAAPGCDAMANTTSGYTGAPMNNTRWVKVRKVFGKCWWGKTVAEYHSGLDERYEFVVGEIPSGHLNGRGNRD